MTDVNEGAAGDTAETVVPRLAEAKPAFGGVTVLESEEEPRDPAEQALLLELYASSFKNIAEGEVIDPEITLPVKWDKALDAFEKATVLNEYLGSEYSDLFLRSRRCEMDRFTSQISNKDFEWYLRSI